jgi:acrylyl-CoA reductase (NADPH)
MLESRQDKRWQPGDAVVLSGWGYGESLRFGLAQEASLQADGLLMDVNA